MKSCKECIRCLEVLEETEFGWHNKEKGRRRTVCRICRNKDAHKWRKKSKEHVNKTVMIRYRRKKAEWIQRLGGCCAHCKNTYPQEVYDFHHILPGTKDKSMGAWFSYSDEKIEVELSKCILLCANCHRIEHIKEKYYE
jgi:hypothetical protein